MLRKAHRPVATPKYRPGAHCQAKQKCWRLVAGPLVVRGHVLRVTDGTIRSARRNGWLRECYAGCQFEHERTKERVSF